MPINPSRSDSHIRLALRLPCCGSVAAPVNVIFANCLKEAPLAGAVMATAGGELTMRTTVVALAVRPLESVTWAVMVCVPSLRVLTARLAPVPSAPLILEIHWILALILPSWASLAVPVKVTVAPWA